jgi:hypothetical protein
MDDTTCMVRACRAHLALLLEARAAASAPRAAKAPAGCTACSTASCEGKATLDDLQMLKSRRRPDRRPHHLRLRRSRRVAGAGLPAHYWHEFEYIVNDRMSTTSAPHRGRSRWRPRHERATVNPNRRPTIVNIEIDGVALKPRPRAR